MPVVCLSKVGRCAVVVVGVLCLASAESRAHVILDQPNGGEVLTVGSAVTIEWRIQIAHNLLNWDLWYSTTGPNGPWISIAQDLPPGSPVVGSVHFFDWTVPDAPSVQVRVRVRMDNSGTDYLDISNSNLTIQAAPVCIDGDGDGFGSPGASSCPNGDAEDCNDMDPAIFPDAVEVCNGVADDDCDGLLDGNDPDCAAPSEVGQWDGPYNWPVVAIHAFMLPTGKVLHYAFPGEIQNPSAYVCDPVTLACTAVPVDRPLFCSGHSFLADGRILVTGGNGPAPVGEFRGIRDTHIFDPFDETWERVEDMADGRWYPTNVTLADGRVLVFSGLDELTGAVNPDVEVYEVGTGWQLVAQQSLPLYPRTFVLSSGDVFYAGPSQETGTYEVDAWSWYGIKSSNYGGRYDGNSVLVPGQPDTVMILGGRNGAAVTATAEILDLDVPAPAWRYTQPMNFARVHSNTVILPDGGVLVIGGRAEVFDEGGGGPPPSIVREAEVFDPTTETWTLLPRMAVARIYHSTALLLPDGRVLVNGSTDIGAAGQTTEFYSPSYLFRGPRPVIASAPTQVPYAGVFEIETPSAGDIQSVVLIRLSSVTHSVNMDQRYVPLEFTPAVGLPNRLLAQAPSSPTLAPPGYYMLFLVDGDGVPSVAEMIQLNGALDAIPTVSEWGMVAMTLALLAVGTIALNRRGGRFQGDTSKQPLGIS